MKRSLTLFCAAASCVAAAQTPELGVCAHLTWDEFAELDRTCDMCAAAGFKWVRCDFEWSAMQKRRGDGFAFAHYGDRLPAVEIWNEENLEHFWPNVNAADYVRLLKTAATAVRTARAKTKVVLGGLSCVPCAYIREMYAAGGRECFDVMNVHPYSWPYPPEGDKDGSMAGLKSDLLTLRKLMIANGDAGKPIWITEHGWPTHRTRLPEVLSIVAGLKIADQGKTAWRVAYACLAEPTQADRQLAAELADVLPKGSSAEACSPRRLKGVLPQGILDAVVYPFSETFPVETTDAVVDFVSRGGTLVDFGGFPVFYQKDEGERMRQRLRIGIAADCGVAKYFIYEFRSPERNPFYSEDNFGIVHADFTPKPAYRMLVGAEF